jgi:hypothetical protein
LTSLNLNVSLTSETNSQIFSLNSVPILFLVNLNMAEGKKKVLLSADLKIALIKCSQVLKNAYPDSQPNSLNKNLAHIFSV